MLFFLICILSLSYANGGSECPDRQDIYPCICIDKPLTRTRTRFENIVICQSLSHAGATFGSGMLQMDIDKFLLYDSYWSTHPRLLQQNARVPVNFLNNLKIKEIKIVDTHLSSLACPAEDNCITNYLRRFTAVNSTVSENSNCPNPLSVKSWISCPTQVEDLHIRAGYTFNLTLRPEFFPDEFTRLKVLRMPYNNIIRIERRTLVHPKFPVLETLDLSHNSLRDIRNSFSSALKLKNLDLSYNNIRNMIDLQFLPNLKHLNLSNNHIFYLAQNEWLNIPYELRTIDLTGNDLICDCNFRWVNSTLHINTNLLGECKQPAEVANKQLRRASRILTERCDANGEIQASRIRPANTTTASNNK